MIDLSSIIQSAQGGQAVDNIAQRFGLSPQQAQSAIDAVLPAIRMGLQNASSNGSAGTILSHLANPAHQQTYDDPGATPPAAAAQGGSILGSLFGGHQATTGVAQQASAESGVSPSVIEAMMPMIISMVMGGLARGAQNGSFGGALSGILGSILGQGGSVSDSPQQGGGPAPAPSGEGGLGGLIGSVLGGLLGGGGSPRNSGAAGEPYETGAAPPAGTVAGATPESTLDEISSMIRAGTSASSDHESRLASILGR